MAIPTWTVGQVLSASDVNSWFVPVVAVKPGDTGRASTTSLTNDPDLTVPVAANATYEVVSLVLYDGGTGASEGDIKYQWTVPSGASLQWNDTHVSIAGNAANIYGTAGTSETAGTVGVGTLQSIAMLGIAIIAGTAGNLVFQWAQNSSNVTNTHVKANSFLRVRRIG